MSDDSSRRGLAGSTISGIADERLTPLVGADLARSGTAGQSAISASLLTAASEALDDGDAAVDDGLVTQSLDAILLAMIVSAADETHGTGLMAELASTFDASVSPGTVYPRLHDLEAEGTLLMHELVQTKQYLIDDRARARSTIEAAARQHFVLGLYLSASLDALDSVPGRHGDD